MHLEQMTVSSLAKALDAGEVSSEELTKAYIERIRRVDGDVGAYLTLSEDEALEQARAADKLRRETDSDERNPLLGVPIAVKDNLCTTGVRTTCASRILENFVPPYDATVIKRLKKIGMPIIGKTNMDELSMGSSTETSALGVTRNPWSLEHVPGGSSGGSAAAVAAGLAPIALGSDSGGSIRQPAAFCGVVGMKPTYGMISRFGMVAFAPSLDQIGPMARDVSDAALLLQHIVGHDPLDGTSVNASVPDYVADLDKGVIGLRIGLPKQFFDGELAAAISSDVREALDQAVQHFEAMGAEIVSVSLPHVEHALATYYVLATAEASSSLGRLDGVRYGYRSPDSPDVSTMFRNTRSEGLGAEAKRRILLGTYFLTGDRYETHYKQALKARTLIKCDFEQVFEQCDVLLSPSAPDVAFKLGEKAADPLQMYVSDLYTIPVNLAGLPGLSMPAGLNPAGLPIGLQIVGRPFGETQVLQVAKALETQVGTVTAPMLQVSNG